MGREEERKMKEKIKKKTVEPRDKDGDSGISLFSTRQKESEKGRGSKL